jgi:hypothetical protein
MMKASDPVPWRGGDMMKASAAGFERGSDTDPGTSWLEWRPNRPEPEVTPETTMARMRTIFFIPAVIVHSLIAGNHRMYGNINFSRHKLIGANV